MTDIKVQLEEANDWLDGSDFSGMPLDAGEALAECKMIMSF